jgi:hypothetical protein
MYTEAIYRAYYSEKEIVQKLVKVIYIYLVKNHRVIKS